jgi:Zn-finger nucleic acid-binding protein
VDRCAACGGIWLDTDELQPILSAVSATYSTELARDTLRRATAGIPAAERAAQVPCPRCAAAMPPLNFSYSSGVILNVCAEHGLWFDRDELERVQAFHEAWEAKKGDVAQEFRAALNAEERAYFASVDARREKDRDRRFFPHLLCWWMDKLAHEVEKARRED